MTQTADGRKKSIAKILARDPDHFKKLGQRGGSAKKTKPSGFASMSRQRLLEVSKQGGETRGHQYRNRQTTTFTVQDKINAV